MTPASHRAVFRELLRREFSERYQGSVLGVAWHFILPLVQLAVLSWVFGELLRARSSSPGLPYPAFLALGLWTWGLLANAIGRGLGSLTENGALIGKVAVPQDIFIDTRVAASAMIDLAAFGLVLAALAVFGHWPALAGVPVMLAGLLVMGLFGYALARMLAVLQVFLRDIGAAIGHLLTLWFFLTPVMYTREQLPDYVARWLGWNPAAAPVEAVRAGFSGLPVDWLALGASAAMAVALLLASRWLFTRARPHLEDFL